MNIKKVLCMFICLVCVSIFSGCSSKQANLSMDNEVNGKSETTTTKQKTTKTNKSDYLDLTEMSGTVIYSQISNIVYAPENYIGTKMKIKGIFNVYDDEKTGKRYFSVIIPDATACCQQGIEFEWKGEHSYPEDYPEDGTEIIVEGEFQTYQEGQFTYSHLIDAELTF